MTQKPRHRFEILMAKNRVLTIVLRESEAHKAFEIPELTQSAIYHMNNFIFIDGIHLSP